MTVLILTIILVSLAIAGIAIKMFLQKDGQFSKSCSSVDASTGKRIGCECGEEDPKSCVNYELHHGLLKED
jgi:hypothetical protein